MIGAEGRERGERGGGSEGGEEKKEDEEKEGRGGEERGKRKVDGTRAVSTEMRGTVPLE